MWQLMLYTWLGAEGLDGLPWKHTCATDGLIRYDRYDLSSQQAMAVIKFAKSYTQLCGKHVLKFFGSDGRDKGLRLSQDKFLRLKAWHASVPTPTVAFNLSSANFGPKMQESDGVGRLAIKEVLSYLGVSGHERFRTMAFELIPSVQARRMVHPCFLDACGSFCSWRQNVQPRIQEYVAKCFPTVKRAVSAVDTERFCCHGYT